MYRVEFARPAAKQLASLPINARHRIIRRIETLADNPRPHGVETLTGSGGALRVRVGAYRVIYEIRDAVLLVLVLWIGHRRDVYRRSFRCNQTNASCVTISMDDTMRGASRQYFDLISTPFKHAIAVVNDGGELLHLAFYGRAAQVRARLEKIRANRNPEACARVRRQLDEYFAGTRRSFDLPLSPWGSQLQLSVWKALVEIPYGETASYLDVSRRLGPQVSPQDVGAANAANPIAIIIPCHRVIGHDGKLVGYAGGLAMKQYLLDLEQDASRAKPKQLTLA